MCVGGGGGVRVRVYVQYVVTAAHLQLEMGSQREESPSTFLEEPADNN